MTLVLVLIHSYISEDGKNTIIIAGPNLRLFKMVYYLFSIAFYNLNFETHKCNGYITHTKIETCAFKESYAMKQPDNYLISHNEC